MTYQELRILVTIITYMYIILTLLLGRVDTHILLALILEHKNNHLPSYSLPRSWIHNIWRRLAWFCSQSPQIYYALSCAASFLHFHIPASFLRRVRLYSLKIMVLIKVNSYYLRRPCNRSDRTGLNNRIAHLLCVRIRTAMYLYAKTRNIHATSCIESVRRVRNRGGSRGKVQGCEPPSPLRDRLPLSNATGVYVRSPVGYAIP